MWNFIRYFHNQINIFLIYEPIFFSDIVIQYNSLFNIQLGFQFRPHLILSIVSSQSYVYAIEGDSTLLSNTLLRLIRCKFYRLLHSYDMIVIISSRQVLRASSQLIYYNFWGINVSNKWSGIWCRKRKISHKALTVRHLYISVNLSATCETGLLLYLSTIRWHSD